MAVILYFGLPGSGKSTYAAKIVSDNEKKHVKTYSNFEIDGAVLYDSSDLGTRELFCGDVIIDEAGIDFNSRKWKERTSAFIHWLKKYRHNYIRDIHVFSQAPDDMDISIRRLASCGWYVRKSLFGLSTLKRLKLAFDIDEFSRQPVITWAWAKGFPRFFWRPRYYWRFETARPLSDFEGIIEEVYHIPVIDSSKKKKGRKADVMAVTDTSVTDVTSD